MKKHYRYHCNYGHKMNECTTLKDKIKELIQIGHLKQFMRRDDVESSRTNYWRYHDRREGCRDRDEEEKKEESTQHGEKWLDAKPPLRSTINTISGGFARGGSSASTRKRHLKAMQFVNSISRTFRRKKKPSITFTDADFQGVDLEQDDPMVIIVEIENFVVKKILVDQDSWIYILYLKTYTKLQLLEETMSHMTSPYSSSLGRESTPRGILICTPTLERETSQRPYLFGTW